MENHLKSQGHLRNNLWEHFCNHTGKKDEFVESDITGFFENLANIHKARDLTNFSTQYHKNTQHVLLKDFPNISRQYSVFRYKKGQ